VRSCAAHSTSPNNLTLPAPQILAMKTVKLSKKHHSSALRHELYVLRQVPFDRGIGADHSIVPSFPRLLSLVSCLVHQFNPSIHSESIHGQSRIVRVRHVEWHLLRLYGGEYKPWCRFWSVADASRSVCLSRYARAEISTNSSTITGKGNNPCPNASCGGYWPSWQQPLPLATARTYCTEISSPTTVSIGSRIGLTCADSMTFFAVFLNQDSDVQLGDFGLAAVLKDGETIDEFAGVSRDSPADHTVSRS
jgi:hypothetical protein